MTSELPWSARWDCDFFEVRIKRGDFDVEVGTSLVSTVGLRRPFCNHRQGAEYEFCRNFPGQHGGIATFSSSASAAWSSFWTSELPWSARWDCDRTGLDGVPHRGVERRNFPGQHGGIATSIPWGPNQTWSQSRNFPGQHGGIATKDPFERGSDFPRASSELLNFLGQYGGIAAGWTY